jgi:hypothetical protein
MAAHIKAAAFTLYIALVLAAAITARWINDMPEELRLAVALILLSALVAVVTRLLVLVYGSAVDHFGKL